MRARFKRLYWRINGRYPSVSALLRRLYFRWFPSTVRRKINGKDNTVIYRNAALSSVLFDIEGNGNLIEVGEGCRLMNVDFHVVGDNHRVLIAPNCTFSQGGRIWLEDRDGLLAIGEGSTFVDVHLAVTEPGSRLIIGRDCMFAYDIDVRTGDSHSIVSEESGERINYAEDVHVGDHVWVGAHVVLLKGSEIAKNSIIATGSIVTHRHRTTGVVIGGNPAKELREGVNWVRERTYKNT